MYWREQASPQEAMNPTYHQTHKIPPGQWNLSVSTCDPSPRSNFEARDDDDDSTEERYYVGRPLFRGQENCTYFSPRQEDTHYETADRFGFFNSREGSPPFTPCATGVRDIDGDFWEDSDLRTAKNFCEPREYEDTRGFYLSIEVDDHGGGDNNDHVYATNWAPAATPDSYGVYPPSMPDGYYNRRYDPREETDEARRYFHRGVDYDFYRDYNFYQSEGSGQGDHYEVKTIGDATGGKIVDQKDEEKEDSFEGVKGSLSRGRGTTDGEFLGKMVDDAIEKGFAEGDDEGEMAPERKLNLLQMLFKEDTLVEAGVLSSGTYVADIRANSGKVGILVVDLSASLSAPQIELRYQAERYAPDWSGALLLSPFYSPRGKWYRVASSRGVDKILSRMQKSFERSGMALDGRNFTHLTMFIGKDTLERRDDDDGKLYIDFARKEGVHSDYYRIVLGASRRWDAQ
ncbi:hypothetical protein FOL46_000309 [Perkinsus olseni]|uniref:Uncharacterized protein n=1 Tax=Perkinsus olseni TaxID=32597 RepID=A0A7J6KX52_PEROL|nr:hypothetical protein FOL46_000309 [Perkinsus olseni]